MNFDLTATVKELNGKEAEKTLAEILAEFLGSETKGNTIKLYYWYNHLLKNKSLDLDDPDHVMLTELITNSERLYVYIKGQLLDALKKNKES